MLSLANLNDAYRKEKEKNINSKHKFAQKKDRWKKQEADDRTIVEGNTCTADLYSYLADLDGKGLI